MSKTYNNIIKLSILFITILISLGLSSCDNQNKEFSSAEKNKSKELKTNTSETETLTTITSQGFDRQQMEDPGESDWKLKVCELWKDNACKSINSDTCRYWQASDTHIGMTPELCVQAMNITLQQCDTNQSFFQFNKRDCKCIENQYRKTTKIPNTANKEGPLFATECFLDREKNNN